MNRFAILVTLALLSVAPLATPVAAQSLAILLPAITFPDPVTTPSTMACVPTEGESCPAE